MAFSTYFVVILFSCFLAGGFAQLTPTFYDETCPNVTGIVREVIARALETDSRITASLIRLHFHDCFVLGCDGSLLLDNTETIESEKESRGNNNSVRGFPVVDEIKAALESACPGIVSCADILAVASAESVYLSQGRYWAVPMGRRDSLIANRSLASEVLPNAAMNLDQLKLNFLNQGLNSTDLVVLSGAHTFGRAQCVTFRRRLFNFTADGGPDPTMNTTLLEDLQLLCPQGGNNSVLTNLDVSTPDVFDKKYFSNLQQLNGLLTSDQVLYSNDTAALVDAFSADQDAFFEAFAASMIKMGNISVLTGAEGEVRANCRRVNGDAITITSSTNDYNRFVAEY